MPVYCRDVSVNINCHGGQAMPLFSLIDWICTRLRGRDGPLPLPQVDGLLENIDGGEPNLLPVALLSKPLRVDIPMWQNSNPTPGRSETLELFWDDKLIDSKIWESPVDPSELFFEVPVASLVDGSHCLCYVVAGWNGGISSSDPLTLTIDKTPPVLNNEGPLVFPPGIISGGVTHSWLVANDDLLSARVPAYQTALPGDVLTWYWSNAVTGREKVDERTLSQADVDKPIMIDFDGAMIRERGNGQRFVTYIIKDRAGNAAPAARAVELKVEAKRPPRQLPAPKIKEASGGGSSWTLDPVAAMNGATVIIPEEAILYDDDKVYLQWGAPDSDWSFRTDKPTSPGSRQYLVPKDKLAAQIGKSDVPVYYEVFEVQEPEPHESVRSKLKVSDLDGLPALQCDCLIGQQISLESVRTNANKANFSLTSWSFMGVGQLVSVSAHGVNASDDALDVVILKDHPVASVVDVLLTGHISLDQLDDFKIGGPMEFKAGVSFDGGQTWKSFGSALCTLAD
ncbi:hypothetical protein IFR09_25970 [Pseudomonas syringae]|nr:hypothetical protein [Pseudomonas syringae]MBD8790816.1 hypothetical protein [Pseudomonas syringae]MBD8802049.1 hypothetical protein [Pseudomonas syringae]MBD8814615.1 hypothetical protein [Pseudomonas syringae]